MKWTKPQKPVAGVSSYDHIMAVTPIGTMLIEWEGWREYGSMYTVSLNNQWITVANDMERAKKKSIDYLKRIVKELTECIQESKENEQQGSETGQ